MSLDSLMQIADAGESRKAGVIKLEGTFGLYVRLSAASLGTSWEQPNQPSRPSSRPRSLPPPPSPGPMYCSTLFATSGSRRVPLVFFLYIHPSRRRTPPRRGRCTARGSQFESFSRLELSKIAEFFTVRPAPLAPETDSFLLGKCPTPRAAGRVGTGEPTRSSRLRTVAAELSFPTPLSCWSIPPPPQTTAGRVVNLPWRPRQPARGWRIAEIAAARGR